MATVRTIPPGLPPGSALSVTSTTFGAGERQKSVLVVEDEALIALDISQRLRRLGYKVCGEADTFEDALAMFRETTPDLVLLDISIRGSIDGQNLKWIRVAYEPPVLIPERLCIPLKHESKYHCRPIGSELKDRDAVGSAHALVQVVEIIHLVFVRQITFVLGGWRYVRRCRGGHPSRKARRSAKSIILTCPIWSQPPSG